MTDCDYLTSENNKALGIDRCVWGKTSAGSDLSTELVVTQTSSLPSHSTAVNHVVQSGEAVAILESIELHLHWAVPKGNGKRTLSEVATEEHSTQSKTATSDCVPTLASISSSSNVLQEALAQIDGGLQTILRTELIRYADTTDYSDSSRFPLVFDGGFNDVRD